MIFREIGYGSADFRRKCSPRDEIVRKPLGLRLADDDLEGAPHPSDRPASQPRDQRIVLAMMPDPKPYRFILVQQG